MNSALPNAPELRPLAAREPVFSPLDRHHLDAPSTVVALRDVSLHFADRTLFDQLNLSVAQGERLTIMGMSGSGKSMLLKLLVGTHWPDRGSIRIFGEEITRMEPAALNALRLRIGFVFQHSALISGLSVRGNLTLPLEELTEKGPEEIESIVVEKLQFVGLPETIDMMPHELSGGMQRRIAIARALVLEPELLLLDEPTSGLDPISGHRIDELIIRLNEEAGVTEIMVGHKMENAFRVGTRIAILSDGRIIAAGSPAELRSSTVPMVKEFLAASVAATPRRQ